MPSSKGFDFFVESSFVEVYNEQCHDLYSKGASVASNLPVLEDVTEGYLVTGLSTKASKNSEEFRTAFNTGRANRDTQVRLLLRCLETVVPPNRTLPYPRSNLY
eukprot:GHUV01017982.1.p1 GENE.GHUV01017982.1~~GHUV01017982.1.p1  ORF type:complete len:104 (-),score=21.15 GHUV01017982.1:527-838(-)